jgi:OmpA-OmpF porin, OOP family
MESKGIWSGLRWPVKAIIIALPVLALVWAANKYGWIPGLKTEQSKEIGKYTGETGGVDDKGTGELMKPLDINDIEFANMAGKPEVRLMNWVWFGNAGIYSANGGQKTAKGSLMEKYGVNLKMITNNSVADMKREQLAFIADYAKGNKNPSTGVHFVTIMGDGAPAYLSAMNEQITKAYGKEYNLKISGIVGFSMGEDCGMGPKKWKENPQNLKGAVISAVIGDGDWALIVRYAADNGIKVNPDADTYDGNAVNFVPAPDDDFLKAAEDAIIGKPVTLKEKDASGKLSGKSVSKKVEGAATWFPGDLNIIKKTDMVKFISTKQYPNQMATVVVGCDKWMKENAAVVSNFFNASLTATNQIKLNPEWFKMACDLSPKVFCTNAQDCSETAADWYKYAKPNGADEVKGGTTISIGGTQMANLADNKKYFGVGGGNNYYKSVYDYFGKVLTDLNPAGFMSSVSKITPYEEAVDLSYMNGTVVDGGKAQQADYTKNKGEKFASKNWKIEFASGSATLTPSSEEALIEIFNQLNIAENAKVQIVGHTDNSGTPDANRELSLQRAKAVKQWLIRRSKNVFPGERFETDGKGQDVPLGENTTVVGKAQNRRVEISLLQ